MAPELKLTDDQLQRIEATLKRIRVGLKDFKETSKPEPASIFIPGAFNAKNA